LRAVHYLFGIWIGWAVVAMASTQWSTRIGILSGDILGLLTIAGLVSAIHVLVSGAVRGEFALDHADPTLVTMWTSAFLHYGWPHLAGNLVAYGLAILPAWVLAVRQQSRLNFWLCVLVIFVGFPFPLGFATDLAFQHLLTTLSSSVSMGFSGVVGGYVGLLFGFLTSYLAVRFDLQTALIGTLVILLSLIGLLLETYPTPGLLWLKTTLLTGIVLGVGFLTAVQWQPVDQLTGSAIVSSVYRYRWPIGLILCCWMTLGVLTILLFPHPSASLGYIPNIVGHTVGLGGGYLLAVLVQFGWSPPASTVGQESTTTETANPALISQQLSSGTGQSRSDVQCSLTWSIVPEQFPPEHLPVETNHTFVRPVVKHQLEIEFQNPAETLPIQVGIHRTDSSDDPQSWTGTVTVSGHAGRPQSMTVDLANTYLTSTFFPSRHLLNPHVEDAVSALGDVEFQSGPRGTLATRPPGTPEQLTARTYSWLRPHFEGESEYQSRHSWDQLPDGEYTIIARVEQDRGTNWQFPVPSGFATQSCTIAVSQRWAPSWAQYQPLADIVQHVLRRKS